MDFGTQFNIAHIEPCTHIYGPGKRFTIWLQGCSLACRNCWNKDMWPSKAKQLLERELLLQRICNTKNIDGITLLGGEPMQQAANTQWLIQTLRQQTELSIMVYTGYEPSELDQKGLWDTLSDHADLIIAGRYDETLRDTYQQWRGSSNQQLIYPVNSRLKQQAIQLNEMEIIISEHAGVTVLGYPDSS
ncbi:4Fe-4S single cluster domain-containing protein [Neptunomonas qingdaonensis]|uniref:Anaerobic ribonucleoside-triphosphate reductase-activating protein n=2 Tax=Neptunomonas qingdaonensis TaxID=1045558 RepID=A0A1I2TTL2_9GAMM|nr:4Fe-4S single cluster domain-containing protein [Neptunomonas qingdaonensis]SFG68188.1 anaerobic ribonucleoside-triphosphate reductase activating protein [Neptunomonas qingdaonensis]